MVKREPVPDSALQFYFNNNICVKRLKTYSVNLQIFFEEEVSGGIPIKVKQFLIQHDNNALLM